MIVLSSGVSMPEMVSFLPSTTSENPVIIV